MRPQAHMLKKVERKRANFLLGFEAWTGVTSLSVGVFGKCGYLIYSASKISYSAATDANLSKNNNQIINGEDVQEFCYEEISLDRLKQKREEEKESSDIISCVNALRTFQV